VKSKSPPKGDDTKNPKKLKAAPAKSLKALKQKENIPVKKRDVDLDESFMPESEESLPSKIQRPKRAAPVKTYAESDGEDDPPAEVDSDGWE